MTLSKTCAKPTDIFWRIQGSIVLFQTKYIPSTTILRAIQCNPWSNQRFWVYQYFELKRNSAEISCRQVSGNHDNGDLFNKAYAGFVPTGPASVYIYTNAIGDLKNFSI